MDDCREYVYADVHSVLHQCFRTYTVGKTVFTFLASVSQCVYSCTLYTVTIIGRDHL